MRGDGTGLFRVGGSTEAAHTDVALLTQRDAPIIRNIQTASSAPYSSKRSSLGRDRWPMPRGDWSVSRERGFLPTKSSRTKPSCKVSPLRVQTIDIERAARRSHDRDKLHLRTSRQKKSRRANSSQSQRKGKPLFGGVLDRWRFRGRFRAVAFFARRPTR
jgi:hypothetical protein